MTKEESCCSEESELWQTALEQDLFPGNLVVEVGRFFLGAPYKADTLEAAGREKLVINLAEFDCTTFVETVLAIIRSTTDGQLSPSEFRKNVKFIRYRQGKIDGYASRLHYFTDWLSDNEKKKVLKDVTRLYPHAPLRKKINFMTAHRELYAGLKKEAEFCKMQLVEKKLSRKVARIIGRDKVTRRHHCLCNRPGGAGCGACRVCRLAGQTPAFAARIPQGRRRRDLQRDAGGLPESKQEIYRYPDCSLHITIFMFKRQNI